MAYEAIEVGIYTCDLLSRGGGRGGELQVKEEPCCGAYWLRQGHGTTCWALYICFSKCCNCPEGSYNILLVSECGRLVSLNVQREVGEKWSGA